MPKQYTFKTTRATQWMEELLDSLPPSERSRFIREAIAEKLGMSDKIRFSVYKDRQSVDKEIPISQPTPQPTTVPEDEPEFDSVKVDLDSVLNNLEF